MGDQPMINLMWTFFDVDEMVTTTKFLDDDKNQQRL